MNNKVIRMCLGAFSLLGLASGVYAQPKYDFSRLQREKLGRGVVAVREDAKHVALSWRYLSSDPMNVSFNVYRNGQRIAKVKGAKGTFFRDTYTETGKPAEYTVEAVGGKVAKGSYTLPANAPFGYVNIPLDRPQDGVTPAGQRYTYSPNDTSVGDVDGDGNYELIIKWDPSNAHDNSHDGYTGNVLIDCYKLSGKKLWRIDLGKNIRAGAHYTQFMVYDLDGDGKAEVVMKTADGTVDGTGTVVGDAKADYRGHEGRMQGRISTGPEYLTIFNGETGKAMQTVDYIPPRGNVGDWGDTYDNRCDRFLACVAYLDGVHPSVVMCRGYYTRSVLAAFGWDGKQLKNRWVFDSNTPGNERYAGQGYHSLRVGDVDGDGCDEIVYGSMTVDNTGKGLYSTGLGHGDALHLTQFDPDSPALQLWACHEDKRDGSTFRDAKTGRILFQRKDHTDVGRCMAADIDPTNRGVEMWSLKSDGIRNIKGEVVADKVPGLSYNMAVWWDGDLSRELLDKNKVSKYDPQTKSCKVIKTFDGALSNNGTKSVPCIQGDLIGDWREEVLMRAEDNTAVRLYVTTTPTQYRFHTFLEDPIYRLSLVTQNVGYNQPTQPGFYIGTDLKKGSVFRGFKIK